MALEMKTAHSLAEAVELGDEACAGALARGRAVDLVAPDGNWRDRRKLMLRSVHPTGVHVQTYDEWVEGLWDLYGDGRMIVSSAQRQILLRPLIAESGLLESSPSHGLVSQFCAFAAEATSPRVVQPDGLGETQRKALQVVFAYEDELEAKGLIEQAQAEALLAELVDETHAVVFENVDLQSPHRRAFAEELASRLDETVIEQKLEVGNMDDPSAAAVPELRALRGALYTGSGGLASEGHVLIGEARGAHALDATASSIVRTLIEGGAAPGDIALVYPDVADSYPHAQLALARAGVPFSARFSLPAMRTPLGRAFCDLVKLRTDPDSDDSYEELAGLVAGPYAGIDGRDARALQMRWRERAQSTPEERMSDIRQGFSQGNADEKTTRERLLPLAELLDAAYPDCLELMLAHEADAHVGQNALADDRAAAERIAAYLRSCEELGAGVDAEELANLPVSLQRFAGDSDDAVSIVDAASLALAPRAYIVMTELDAAHYPMARQAGPFDSLLEKLGIGTDDETVIQQRLKLLNLVESARAGIAFCRSTHDELGNESVQSALWDEVMTCYRSADDEDTGLAIQEVPAALRPHTLGISEADLFARGQRAIVSQREVVRGKLDGPDAVRLLSYELSGKETPFSPTAIEDYYRCPYRWFTCRRVGYNAMDNEFDAAAQGNLAHAVLERFYKTLKKQGVERVTPDNLDIALELVSKALDEQVAHDENRNRGGIFVRTVQDRYEIEEIRKMLLDFVRRDATFLPGFVPTYFELTLGKGTGTMLEYGGVPVRGKVDRIDVDAEGNAVVIDYKLSGLSQGYGLDPERDIPGRIQTDIYAKLVQRHFDLMGVQIRVVGSVYRSYSHNCLRGAYSRSIEWGDDERVFENKDALPRSGRDETYDEYLDEVEETVAACMARLHEGHIEPDPLDGNTKDICEFCKALSFCPKAEG